jgi:hypothetical protein
MASAAILGASGGLASAQTPTPPVANPSQGQMVAPYGAGSAANNNNNAWGIANTPTGSAAAGPLSTVYAPNVDAVPAPGTVVIRLNGRIESEITASFTSADKGTGANAPYKVNPLGIGTFARLYPGFDGLAANGIRYGGSIELRENFGSGTFSNGNLGNSAPTTTTLTQTATAAATSPSANSSAETVFVRRAFTYVASDQLGLIRLGQGDGVVGLFDNCIFTSQCYDAGMGNFNGGDIQSESVQGPLAIPFVWLSQAGADYTNNKIVYLSPQFYGFDFGIQYAPSMGNSLQNSGNGVTCTQASPQCISVTSGTDPTRWYNQVAGGVRFQQTFGAVDFKAYAMGETAQKENVPSSQYIALTPTNLAARTTANIRYKNLAFAMAGTAITAYNVTWALDYIGGQIGSSAQLAMEPQGGIGMNAIVTGFTYANGPITAGIEVGGINGQGAAQLVGISQRREEEFAVGGAYKMAPGIQFVGEYMYEHRHQGNFNFNTGVVGAGTADSRANSFLTGIVVTW